MAAWKLTINRGQTSQDATQGASAGVGSSDAIAIEIDVTNMTQREAVVLIDELKKRVLDSAFPATA